MVLVPLALDKMVPLDWTAYGWATWIRDTCGILNRRKWCRSRRRCLMRPME